jgi:hypothetical protein
MWGRPWLRQLARCYAMELPAKLGLLFGRIVAGQLRKKKGVAIFGESCYTAGRQHVGSDRQAFAIGGR